MLDMLEPIVLNQIFALSQFILAILYLLLMPIYKKKHMKKIAYGLTISFIGVIAFVLDMYLPYHIGLTIGHFNTQIGLVLVTAGMVDMTYRIVNYQWLYKFFAIHMLFLLFFTYVIYSANIIVIIYAGFQLIVSCYLMYELILAQKTRKDLILSLLVFIVFGFALSNIWRIQHSIFVPADTSLLREINVEKVFMLYVTLATILRAILIQLYHLRELYFGK